MNTYYTRQEVLQAVRLGRLSIRAATAQLAQLKQCALNKAMALKAAS